MTVDQSETSAAPAYSLTVEQALAGLDTAADGLSSEQARQRLASHGPNRLPEPERDSALKRFLKHFDDGFQKQGGSRRLGEMGVDAMFNDHPSEICLVDGGQHDDG